MDYVGLFVLAWKDMKVLETMCLHDHIWPHLKGKDI